MMDLTGAVWNRLRSWLHQLASPDAPSPRNFGAHQDLTIDGLLVAH